jgi:hypothetical protein
MCAGKTPRSGLFVSRVLEKQYPCALSPTSLAFHAASTDRAAVPTIAQSATVGMSDKSDFKIKINLLLRSRDSKKLLQQQACNHCR